MVYLIQQFILYLFAFYTLQQNTFSQDIAAKTNDGRDVVLFSDGSWKFCIPSSNKKPSSFVESQSDRE